jgi:lauroyl/myristoyl acyltransferase
MKIGISAGAFGFDGWISSAEVRRKEPGTCLSGKDARSERFLKAAFQNMGRVMAVVSRFDDLSRQNLADLIEYEPDPVFAEQYERTKTDGRGRIILGGHMGNWELQAFTYPFVL